MRKLTLWMIFPSAVEYETMEHFVRHTRASYSVDKFPKANAAEEDLQHVVNRDLTEDQAFVLKQFLLNNYALLEFQFNLSTLTETPK